MHRSPIDDMVADKINQNHATDIYNIKCYFGIGPRTSSFSVIEYGLFVM